MSNLLVANRYSSEASAKFPATVDTVIAKILPGTKLVMEAEFVVVLKEKNIPKSASVTLTIKY